MKTDWKAFLVIVIILYVFSYAGMWWGIVSILLGVVALGWKDRNKGPFETNQSELTNQKYEEETDSENIARDGREV